MLEPRQYFLWQIYNVSPFTPDRSHFIIKRVTNSPPLTADLEFYYYPDLTIRPFRPLFQIRCRPTAVTGDTGIQFNSIQRQPPKRGRIKGNRTAKGHKEPTESGRDTEFGRSQKREQNTSTKPQQQSRGLEYPCAARWHDSMVARKPRSRRPNMPTNARFGQYYIRLSPYHRSPLRPRPHLPIQGRMPRRKP